MGEGSKIQWTHHTFNPWWGCARVSPGCENCYAETFAKRIGHGARLPQIWGVHGERKLFGDKHWAEPLKWNAAAERVGERHRVFCASMADVFEDREDLVWSRARLFKLITETPHLDWLLLTKRPENVRMLAPWQALVAEGHYDRRPAWPANVWIGTTVEDQERAERRIPWLLEIPAAVRFLSVEPQLGPVDLENVVPYYLRKHQTGSPFEPILAIDALRGYVKGPDEVLEHRVDWIIVGGESGPGARPFELAWARSVLRQARVAGVPVFVKQLGACASDPENGIAGASLRVHADAMGLVRRRLHARAGGDPTEWPEELRIRQFPAAKIVPQEACRG